MTADPWRLDAIATHWSPGRAAHASGKPEDAAAARHALMLDHAGTALKDDERDNPGTRARAVLKLRTDFPDDTSEHLAERLSAKVGAPARPDACRQMLRAPACGSPRF